MKLDGILGPELEQQDFRLEKHEDLVCLTYKGELVATYYMSTASVALIKAATRAWLKEHETA